MNDYFNLFKEYQELQTYSKDEINEINIIIDNINSFKDSISFLHKNIASIPYMMNNSFDFLMTLSRNLTKNIIKPPLRQIK